MRFFREKLPHLMIALLLGLATITVLHGFNPAMGFLTSLPSKVYIFTTCIVGIIEAIVLLSTNRE